MILPLPSTNFGLRSIKQALRKVACEAGLEHRGWWATCTCTCTCTCRYNPGSTWFGAAGRVRHLARLTVALAALGKAALFGPGTQCRWPNAATSVGRCAECTDMPSACAWSKGPYPGVLLLYMQVTQHR